MSSESSPGATRSPELAARVGAFRAATEELVALASTLSEADLDRQPPEPDGWTPRMVIHHVADSETNAYVRLRRLLAGPPGTTIQGYDQDHWARVLHYDRPVDVSLALIRAVRDSSAELLELITDADLSRSGVHTESGPYALEDWLANYVRHPHDHAAQIRAALA